MILHVDLDAFYAAVEQRDHAELRGKPVLVGGSARRGVVASCSYEARRFGIKSAMPMAEALRRCPHAIVVRHRMDRYVEASRTFFAILGDFAPEVEGLSLDEAFLDITGTERLLGTPRAIGEAIKQRVRGELSLVASVGAAPIKFAAKIASDIDKPDGLRIVEPAQLIPFLHPLPTSRLWGVGDTTNAVLASFGLRTIGDVARYPESALVARLGAVTGPHLAALARGEDPRPVVSEREAVTIGHQQTFEHDLDDKGEIAVILLDQADRVAARLRAAELRARAVVLIIKYDDFRQITRRTTLETATSDGGVLARTAIELLAKVPIESTTAVARVRLCGISATQLEERDAPRQLGFDEAARARGERLGSALDKVAAKFDRKGTIRRAVHLPEGKTSSERKIPPRRQADARVAKQRMFRRSRNSLQQRLNILGLWQLLSVSVFVFVSSLPVATSDRPRHSSSSNTSTPTNDGSVAQRPMRVVRAQRIRVVDAIVVLVHLERVRVDERLEIRAAERGIRERRARIEKYCTCPRGARRSSRRSDRTARAARRCRASRARSRRDRYPRSRARRCRRPGRR